MQSFGLFLFKLAGIHRITEYFGLGEEFIWSSTPAQGRGSSCGRSGCLGICPPEIWISLTMKFPQPVGEVVSQHPHSDSFLPQIPSGLPLLGSSQPCILAGLLPPRWCVPLAVVWGWGLLWKRWDSPCVLLSSQGMLTPDAHLSVTHLWFMSVTILYFQIPG